MCNFFRKHQRYCILLLCSTKYEKITWASKYIFSQQSLQKYVYYLTNVSNWSGVVILCNSCGYCSVYKLQDRTEWVRDFSVWPIRSGPFRSGVISVRLWNLAEILHVHILMQTYLNQRDVLLKKTTNKIQDPTVNQHKHMIFIIISKRIKSLSTFCNQIQILQSHNYNSDLIAIMTPQRELVQHQLEWRFTCL